FMARGEPLLNPLVHNSWDELSEEILKTIYSATGVTVPVHFLISTIFPMTLSAEKTETMLLVMANSTTPPRIYYSAYPCPQDTRRKWVPKGHMLFRSMMFLDLYGGELQDYGMDDLNKIHFPVIKGVTDDLDFHRTFTSKMCIAGRPVDSINLIRYNPPYVGHSEEADDETYEKVAEIYREYGYRVKIIPRVGADVKASCGTFLNLSNGDI